VYFNEIEIENHLKELMQIDYQLNWTSKNISTVYVNVMLAEDVMTFNGTLNIRLQNGGKYVNFGNQDFDCNGMSMVYNHFLFQIIVVSLRAYSNFPLSCPLRKNKLYYLNGFKIETDIVRSYFPEVSFETDAKLIYNQRLAVHVVTKGQLVR
ncbi:hypothetical protein KR093_011453, partial [Drosophila rubida]